MHVRASECFWHVCNSCLRSPGPSSSQDLDDPIIPRRGPLARTLSISGTRPSSSGQLSLLAPDVMPASTSQPLPPPVIPRSKAAIARRSSIVTFAGEQEGGATAAASGQPQPGSSQAASSVSGGAVIVPGAAGMTVRSMPRNVSDLQQALTGVNSLSIDGTLHPDASPTASSSFSMGQQLQPSSRPGSRAQVFMPGTGLGSLNMSCAGAGAGTSSAGGASTNSSGGGSAYGKPGAPPGHMAIMQAIGSTSLYTSGSSMGLGPSSLPLHLVGSNRPDSSSVASNCSSSSLGALHSTRSTHSVPSRTSSFSGGPPPVSGGGSRPASRAAAQPSSLRPSTGNSQPLPSSLHSRPSSLSVPSAAPQDQHSRKSGERSFDAPGLISPGALSAMRHMSTGNRPNTWA